MYRTCLTENRVGQGYSGVKAHRGQYKEIKLSPCDKVEGTAYIEDRLR